MANGDGSFWLKMGQGIRAAGPYGAIVLLTGLLVWQRIDNGTAVTHTETTEMEQRLNAKIDGLAQMIVEHIKMPSHFGSTSQVATIEVNQKHILAALDRLDRSTQKVIDVADDLRIMVQDHEIRIKALEAK